MARIVLGEERRDIDVEIEDVADRVLILDAAETPERIRSTGIRMSCRSGVER
jgi:hypothetical protein